MSNRKIAAVALAGIAAVCLIAFATAYCIAANSFHLRLYADGFSSEGGYSKVPVSDLVRISDERDGMGSFKGVRAVYWIPATVASEEDPEWVIYRSHQENVTFSLPNGEGSTELAVPWSQAGQYVQLWIHMEFEGETAVFSTDFYSDRNYDQQVFCINALNPNFLEVELQYANGFKASKYYSAVPGDKSEYGLKNILVTES